MSYSYPDILFIPGTGNTANLDSVICNAPKGAKNQFLNISYYGDSSPQPTGAGLYNTLTKRLMIPSVVVVISG